MSLGGREIELAVSLCAQRVQCALQGHNWGGVSDTEHGNRWQRGQGSDLGHCWPRALQGCHLCLLRGAVGALIVYDITRKTTFESVGRWLDELKTHSDTTVAMMLVGNKCDLENIRDVSVEDGKSLAEAEGLFFMETSALDSTNVIKAFELVIQEIYNNVSRKVLNSDTYKAELSVNRVSLVNNGADGSKKSQGYFSCCSG
ncbi:RAB GTPase homolog A5E [Prunus dulcis]|uniref:RAB GTPase homolog A5E n=1 Tax=Prunus dulcis TaxID=3755 RepID=A0A4Y1QNV7_PRUDU|nr:RAB GTPase homolog A5E [Prunus dulcis]